MDYSKALIKLAKELTEKDNLEREIEKAINDKEELTFLYTKVDGSKKERKVMPLTLIKLKGESAIRGYETNDNKKIEKTFYLKSIGNNVENKSKPNDVIEKSETTEEEIFVGKLAKLSNDVNCRVREVLKNKLYSEKNITIGSGWSAQEAVCLNIPKIKCLQGQITYMEPKEIQNKSGINYSGCLIGRSFETEEIVENAREFVFDKKKHAFRFVGEEQRKIIGHGIDINEKYSQERILYKYGRYFYLIGSYVYLLDGSNIKKLIEKMDNFVENEVNELVERKTKITPLIKKFAEEIEMSNETGRQFIDECKTLVVFPRDKQKWVEFYNNNHKTIENLVDCLPKEAFDIYKKLRNKKIENDIFNAIKTGEEYTFGDKSETNLGRCYTRYDYFDVVVNYSSSSTVRKNSDVNVVTKNGVVFGIITKTVDIDSSD